MKNEWIFGDIAGDNYVDFINYCVETCDYCMLVYRYYKQKGLPDPIKFVRNQLRPLCVKTKSDSAWPGTPFTFADFYRYRICFYKLNDDVKSILYNAQHLFGFDSVRFPQDVAFFRRNKCFIYSVVHEKFASMVDPEKKDKEMLKKFVSNYRISTNDVDDTDSAWAKVLYETLDSQN